MPERPMRNKKIGPNGIEAAIAADRGGPSANVLGCEESGTEMKERKVGEGRQKDRRNNVRTARVVAEGRKNVGHTNKRKGGRNGVRRI